MAIINTFEKCLESPYLSVDDTAPSQVKTLLGQAANRLQFAEQLFATGANDSVDISFFAHEAMFCCIRALVYAKGYREGGQRCLLLALFSLYIKPGMLDSSYVPAFEAAQSLKATPEENLKAARALLADSNLILEN